MSPAPRDPFPAPAGALRGGEPASGSPWHDTPLRAIDGVEALLFAASALERTDAGTRRFPLLGLVRVRASLAPDECEALVWELARLRTILAATARSAAVRGAQAPAWERTIAALDAAARLGATSRRGARLAADETSHAPPGLA